MENQSDEDIPNPHPEIQIIEQGDAPEGSEMSSRNRSQFQVVVEEGALAAAPP